MFIKKYHKIIFVSFAIILFSTSFCSACTKNSDCSSGGTCEDGLCKFVSGGTLTGDSAKIVIPTPVITISDKLTFEAPSACSDDSSKMCIWWLGKYTQAVYNLAVGVVGIFAAVGLMVAGFIWLTAGGNASKVGEARAWIASSLTGLVLVLGSYIILYYVNPELTKIKPLKVRQVKETAKSDASIESSNSRYNCTMVKRDCNENESWESSKCNDMENSALNDEGKVCCCTISAVSGCSWKQTVCDTTNETDQTSNGLSQCGTSQSYGYCCCTKAGSGKGGSKNCSDYDYDKNNIADYENVSGSIAIPSSCNNYDFGQTSCNAQTLKIIASIETSCQIQATSPKGACGMMQIMPSNASSLGTSCSSLQGNANLSIQTACKYIQQNCGNKDFYDTLACYNGGPKAVQSSNSCSNAGIDTSIYRCCLSNDGYGETRKYVADGQKYLNYFK
jgi:hypothetical protein